MPSNRSYSAPPVDKFVIEDDVELDEREFELKYSNYNRKNKDPRLHPPKYLFKGQSSYWANEHNDFILKAFSEQNTFIFSKSLFLDSNNKNLYIDNSKIMFIDNKSLFVNHKKKGIEMIDSDYPDSESCSEFSGKSRTNTPVGDNTVYYT